MSVYRVGGYVRDRLLGRDPADCDYVVVGATVDEMLSWQFKLVGAEFGVFLHPETGDEYALARTERKIGPGYKGFSVYAEPDVTLEEDLARRDLTINAMAEDEQGNLIDPYGGRKDLEAGVLRHVSDAFREDPVRILRVARFAARYGFSIAPETAELMCAMVEAGEVDALTPERVWLELEKSLGEASPSGFFMVLRACGALVRLFPEVDALFGVPQPAEHHPEIDSGVHTMMALEAAARLTDDQQVRFAVLVHDLGKGLTPKAEWPKHIKHESEGVGLVEAMCSRYKAPAAYRTLGKAVAEHHLRCHRVLEMKASSIVKLLGKLDAFRRPERLQKFILACHADAIGRKGFEDRPYPQAEFLLEAYAAASQVSAKAIVDRGITGERVGEMMHEERTSAVKRMMKS
ncbi:MAG: multifunctional CCA addition/repair protein [Candidatus Thiodiazotropha sp.]